MNIYLKNTNSNSNNKYIKPLKNSKLERKEYEFNKVFVQTMIETKKLIIIKILIQII